MSFYCLTKGITLNKVADCVIINGRSLEKNYAFGSCFRMLAVILVSDSSYLRTQIPEVAYALTIPVSPCFFPGSFLG